MSRENQSSFVNLFNLAFGLAFAALVGSFIWAVSGDQAVRRETARQHAHQYAFDARERIAQVCGRRRGQAFAECVVETVATTREYQRGERELAAQQEMANWSLGMLLLSGAAVIISGLGFIALLRTVAQGQRGLERSQEGNRIAEDTAKRQLRAYIVVKAFKVIDVRVRKTPRICFEIKNVGQTPAYDVRSATQVFTVDDGASASLAKARFIGKADGISKSVVGSGESSEVGVPLTGPLSAKEIARLRSRVLTLAVFGVVSYRDIFKRRRLLTFKKQLNANDLDEDGCAIMISCERGNSGN